MPTRPVASGRATSARTRRLDPLAAERRARREASAAMNRRDAEARMRLARVSRSGGWRGARRVGAGALVPLVPSAPDATTRTLEGLYPFLATSSGGVGAGLVIGVDVHSAAAFTFEPFALYQRRVISNPSVLLLGEIGSRKSTLLKTTARRALTIGRRVFVVDPKGEYAKLAADVGGVVVRLAPGGEGDSLSPILTGNGVHAANIGLVEAILSLTRGGAITPTERHIVAAATALLSGYNEATGATMTATSIAAIAAALRSPSVELLAATRFERTEFFAAARDLSYLFDRLCDPTVGDLAGMVDQPSTTDLHEDVRLVVIDVSAAYAQKEAVPAAFPLAMLAAMSWVQGQVIARPQPSYLFVDEAWAVFTVLGVARHMQGALKLARQWGLSVWLAMHRLSDLRVGDERSELHGVVRGLLSDIETHIVYRQNYDQRGLLTDWIGLPEGQLDLVTSSRFPDGRGLWRFGAHVALVDHRVTPAELAISDTDSVMR